MSTIDQFKEQQTPPTPLFLFDCTLSSGAVERWSTHAVTVNGNSYLARLMQHNLFVLQASSDSGLDGAQKISLGLANADSHFSQIERETGFKGASLTVQIVFYDLVANAPVSETRVIFRGVGNPPDEITESACRISFTNRLNLQRIILPDVRIERRCPWMFPTTAAQRLEAVNGGVKGKYSALQRCGYSPDQTGGTGNLNGTTPYTTCDYTQPSCVARGMFDKDLAGNVNRRFGGIEYVPAQIDVRSYGEQGTHLSAVIDNVALYNDFVPLVYGTAWFAPPIVFSRNDGNLTHMEVLLGMGEIDSVVTVVVNGVQIPQAQAGANMTGTGWFSVVSHGTRNGAFNPDFVDSTGNLLGDPYGSMAVLSVVVPNQISSGQTLASVEVLLRGLKLEQFNAAGVSLGGTFTNNPAWVLLDVLRRSGWLTTDLNLPSFAAAASFCDQVIETTDLYGNAAAIPRFQCNLVLHGKWSAAEAASGIRNGSSLMLSFDKSGLLQLRVEQALAVQQPALPDGSNSTAMLNGGWPAYEFSDGSASFSGILRKPNGDPTVRLWSRSGADTPNRLTVEFQDEFNQYQQDSLALIDVDDSLLTSREVSAAFQGIGLPNFDQATRMLQLQLNKALSGYTFVDFETTVRGVGLSPGDIITITYLKEGLNRQPFRVVKLAPGQDFQTLAVTAQWHDDGWYTLGAAGAMGGSSSGDTGFGLPKPLVGSVLDANGIEQFGITETVIEGAAGTAVALSVAFVPPAKPSVTGAAIPLLSLSPSVQTTGGTLAGNRNLYYAITAVDASGVESSLSFVVWATIPGGTNTNAVTLTGMSFSGGTAGFHVYRGPNPSQLLRIASNVAVAGTYTDSGATAALLGPPDGNYDHANFYWRRELYPEVVADTFSATTIGNSTMGLAANAYQGNIVRITRGTGATQERAVTANSGTTFTVSPPWTVIPDGTSYLAVADSAWNFGAVGSSSPVQFQVPNWGGQTIEISGRSANANDQESAYALNPLTRWQVGSGTGTRGDAGFPPLPAYSLITTGQGTLELEGISFPTLTNTISIAAGTLTLYYWDELNGQSTVALASAIAATDTTITLNQASTAQVNDFIQIDVELLQVVAVQNGGLQLVVTRGGQQSVAAAYLAGAAIYLLERKVAVVPFARDFFASPSSASFTYSMFLPDVRVVAAEFFVTNTNGTSPVQHLCFTATADRGLRTHSGGQIALQVEGYLAVQTSATPPYVMEASHAVNNIVATVREAPSGGSLVLLVRQNATAYCTLTIPAGATVSNTVSGDGLPALAVNSQINLDVQIVPTAANSLPGRDLTVTIGL
jgi:hypothetical protein